MHLAKYEKYTTFEPNTVHGLHIVSFHRGDDYGNAESNERFSYYSAYEPHHKYDGGYRQAAGNIGEDKINSSGVRPIHKLEIDLLKSIDDSTLSFQGSVTNLESNSFNGFMLVFITENNLFDPFYGMIWNFVFLDYGLNKTLSLDGKSTDPFNGAWAIPGGVNASNIQVIAAAYDINTRDPEDGWPYAVQSVCDVCLRSEAIPEFLSTTTFIAFLVIVSVIAVLLLRKRVPLKHGSYRGKDTARSQG